MNHPRTKPARAALPAVLALLSACAIADGPRRTTRPTQRPGGDGRQGIAAQALIGAAFYDDLTFRRTSASDPGVAAEIDLSDMPILGVAGQQRLGGGGVEVGFEAGLLFGWRGERSSAFSTIAGTAIVVVDRSLFVTDLFAGLYASTELGRVRAYAGAGPLLMWAHLDVDDDDRFGSDTEFSAGGYVRGGLEYRLDDGSFLGVGVRALATDIEFVGQDVDMDGVQAMLTYTQMF